jgi:hypothetical protein
MIALRIHTKDHAEVVRKMTKALPNPIVIEPQGIKLLECPDALYGKTPPYRQ